MTGKQRVSEEKKEIIYDSDEQEDEDYFVSHERRGIVDLFCKTN